MTADLAAARRTDWTPYRLVPSDAPAPRFRHPVRGEPARIFKYCDAEGNLHGYVCRFLRSAGGAMSLPLTWCRNTRTDERGWRWVAFEKLRPIFGAERLQAEVNHSIVLVVGDELAAAELWQRPGFKAYDVVSWPGGMRKLGEVDWSVLKQRMVLIWLPHSAERYRVAKGDPQSGDLLPIAKQPWRVAARRLEETLREHGAIPIGIVEAETTEELEDGWDACRAEALGWDEARLVAWFDAHFGSRKDVAEANRLATPPRASGSGDELWMRTLIRKDGTGALLPELHNVRLLLSHHPSWKGCIYLDEFSHTVMKAAPPPFQGGQAGEWSDTDDSMAGDWLASNCGILKLRSPLVAEAVGALAKLSSKNPLVEHLRSLKWDRTPRLETWLRRYLRAGPFTEDMSEADAERLMGYLAIVGRLWLMGAVKRALEPGCKFDYMLILEGQQGLGKSSVAAIIGGQWAMDSPFSLSDKEGMENIRGKWIVEIPELDGFNKAESTAAKSFFSRQKDRFRMPYAKRSVDFKRACVFLGTTNEDEYFRDATGNRRYWPVHCERRGYDREALARDRDQLLAEAMHRIKAGEQYWPTREEERLVQAQQRTREVPDPWVGKIAAGIKTWQKSPDSEMEHLTRELVLTKMLHIEAGRIDERGMAVRVGRAMHKLGYVKVEDRSLPERFFYKKLQGPEQGDDD